MKLIAVCWLLLFGAITRGEEWKPPENPDPEAIRNEAQKDTQARRYEVALAKYVWYYENAMKYRPSLSGVRLSSGLSDWGRLADSYPPALVKMKEIRDQLKNRIQQSERVAFEDFQDLAALDRELDNESATVDTFLVLDARSSKTAQRMFRLAEPALVRAQQYAICGKYVDSEQSLGEIVRMFNLNQAMVKDGRVNASHQEFTEKKFINASALLVAILVKNERKAEAETVASELKKVSMDPKLLAKLDTELTKALQGIVPMPWP
jgi:hypothetical protein